MTKTTYLGLDVHAATIAIATLEEGQERPETTEITNDPAAIRKAFKRLAKGRTLRCTYEAGPCGYVLQRQLTPVEIDCQVIAPSLTSTDRSKHSTPTSRRSPRASRSATWWPG